MRAKKTIKKFEPNNKTMAYTKAGQSDCLRVVLSTSLPVLSWESG